MRKGWLFGGLAAMALTSVLWARQGVVHLKDGTPLAGEIDESDPQQIVVSLHGISETVLRPDIQSIEYPGSIDEQYAARMDKLAEGDINGRLTVASWAQAAGRYDLARRAAAEALDIDPANAKALELLRDINADAALGHGAATRPASAQPTAAVPATNGTNGLEKPYLSLDQVNEIRQIELRDDDTFGVTFVHDVRQRFLDLGTTDARTFYALTAVEQAREILAAGNATLNNDVRIDTDPAAMTEYHTRIQPYVLGGCAISGCHSPVAAAGGFGLFTGDESPRAWYTNFYLLQSYVRPPNRAGAPGRLMIDRSQAEQSLLLNYGLLPAVAPVPHPKAQNYRPMFPARNEPHYELFVHWIGLMLKPDGGSYPGISYQPPWAPAAATTRP